MQNLVDVANALKAARAQAGLTQEQLAQRAGVARTTVARMETSALNDMSVAALLKLLTAAGHELKVVKHGHRRTLDDILAEQRQPDA